VYVQWLYPAPEVNVEEIPTAAVWFEKEGSTASTGATPRRRVGSETQRRQSV
jgi:hypothetical protein